MLNNGAWLQEDFPFICKMAIHLVCWFDSAFGNEVDMARKHLIIKNICRIIKASDVYFTLVLINKVKSKDLPRAFLVSEVAEGWFILDMTLYGPIWGVGAQCIDRNCCFNSGWWSTLKKCALFLLRWFLHWRAWGSCFKRRWERYSDWVANQWCGGLDDVKFM